MLLTLLFVCQSLDPDSISLPVDLDPQVETQEAESYLPEIGKPAPSHALKHWLGDPTPSTNSKQKVVTKESFGGDADQPKQLAKLIGRVVMIHAMQPNSQGVLRHTAPLIRDLHRANLDRGIGLITLIPKEDGNLDMIERLEISWPVAEYSADSKSPYLDSTFQRDNYVWIISRSGFLAWHGNPQKSEKEFLSTVQRMLDQSSAPSLEIVLNTALNKAVSAYADGDWNDARRRAEKLLKKHGKRSGEDDQIIYVDASYLVSIISEHESSLVLKAKTALDKKRLLQFLQFQHAIKQGFAKTDSVKQTSKALAEYKKNRIGSSLEDAIALRELLIERPLLFPARKSSAGDRLNKELEQFVMRSSNDISPTQLARKLMDDYSSAVRKR